MGFWMMAGLIAVMIGGVLALTVLRPREDATPSASYDLQVYRDQLREVDRDLARGLLTQADAERTRTEVARRVLGADRALQSDGTGAAASPGRMVVIAGLSVVIAGAFALYWHLGAPGYPDLPLETRIALVETARTGRPNQAAAEAEISFAPRQDSDANRAELVAQLRTAMERNPDEAEGLELLAHEEARLGNFRAARLAQNRLITLLGADVEARHYLDMAEMMFMAAGGYVSPETEQVLQTVLERAPGNGAARYYVGLMYAQQGRPDLGYPIWRALLADSEPGDPWLGPIRDQIEFVAAMAGDPIAVDDLPQPPQLDMPGPTGADIAAAGNLSAEDQMAMIETMVAGLAERLANEGGPAPQWARLISSYLILGQTDAARSIYDEALVVFAGSDDALDLIREAGTGLEPDQ